MGPKAPSAARAGDSPFRDAMSLAVTQLALIVGLTLGFGWWVYPSLWLVLLATNGAMSSDPKLRRARDLGCRSQTTRKPAGHHPQQPARAHPRCSLFHELSRRASFDAIRASTPTGRAAASTCSERRRSASPGSQLLQWCLATVRRRSPESPARVTNAGARPVHKIDVPCVQCGAHDDEPLWTGREHEYDNTTNELFTFVRCRRCKVVRLNPRPDVSELARIYPPNYYAYNLVAGGQDRLFLTDRIKKRMYQRRFTTTVDHLAKRGKIRLLDVGCGDGRLLDWYRQSVLADRLETHGIEISESAADTARRRGHRVITGRFEVDHELEPGSFDLILAAHVIEHVDDPKGFAERAAELLAPGGLFVVATPNWNSADARKLREHWGGNHFPRHWTLYEEKTLSALAQAVGLETRANRVPAESNLLDMELSFVALGPISRKALARSLVPSYRHLLALRPGIRAPIRLYFAGRDAAPHHGPNREHDRRASEARALAPACLSTPDGFRLAATRATGKLRSPPGLPRLQAFLCTAHGAGPS